MPQPITLEMLLQQDSELSSLPEIYIRVSELLDNDNSSAHQIGQVVETDPALTTRILKMVNSAYYGFQHEIASIAQAITILGRDRLRQILIGTVLGGVFGKMDNKIFFMEDFWFHSVKTAILARFLCRQTSITSLAQQAETLFTAGLLHEIGRLILVQKLPELSIQVQQAIDMDDADLFESEKTIFGFTHCETGAAFIKKWGLPDILSDIAKFHHMPEQSAEYQDEARMIFLANNLVFLVAPIQQEEVEYALEDIDGWQKLGLTAKQITESSILADEQVYEVMDSLGMVQMKIEMDD